jgi:hypothetical protein
MGQSMVTSRSVPQQIEQMLSARAGHNRLAFRLLQIGHVNVFSCGDSETKIMPQIHHALGQGARYQVPSVSALDRRFPI